jgi:hypothetical protein
MAATITVIKEGVNEDVFFNPAWTGAQAEKKIRERFLLQGGGLEDVDTGFTVGDDDNLGDRQLRFVGGRSTGDYLSLNHSCQFKYTHVPSHSFSITSALNLFLYISSHISIALDNLKSHYISWLTPHHLSNTFTFFCNIAQTGGGQGELLCCVVVRCNFSDLLTADYIFLSFLCRLRLFSWRK